MASAFRLGMVFPAALLGIAALGACGEKKDPGDSGAGSAEASQPPAQLFADDFKGVCSGASVASATAYDPAGKAHKALYFGSYKDDLTDRSTSLPDDWTVQYAPEGDAYKAIDLVVCARRTAAKEVKICDGYKDKDKPTENKVRWHTATYTVSVAEAKTGRKLAETTIEATDSDCPMFMSFDGNDSTVDSYASLSDTAIADFLRPHMGK